MQFSAVRLRVTSMEMLEISHGRGDDRRRSQTPHARRPKSARPVAPTKTGRGWRGQSLRGPGNVQSIPARRYNDWRVLPHGRWPAGRGGNLLTRQRVAEGGIRSAAVTEKINSLTRVASPTERSLSPAAGPWTLRTGWETAESSWLGVGERTCETCLARGRTARVEAERVEIEVDMFAETSRGRERQGTGRRQRSQVCRQRLYLED